MAATKKRGTQLTGTWYVEKVGPCSIRSVGNKDVERIDVAWPTLRPSGAPHLNWKWKEIREATQEQFRIESEGQTVAIWASKRTAVKLGGKTWYRLDFLEVDPAKTGILLGAFTMCAVANRAVELRRDGLLLGAFPQVADFYRALDGKQELVSGWKCESGLVPFVFEREALGKLKERIHDFVEEAEEK